MCYIKITMSKKLDNLYNARRKLEPENDTAVPAHRVAYRMWYRVTPWVRTMMKWSGAFNPSLCAPEIYGYRRVSTYKCEIDQEEAQKAFMVITLKKAGLTDAQIARGMSVRYGETPSWWSRKIPQILNGYKYYCGRHLVYNGDGEAVYPPFMEP